MKIISLNTWGGRAGRDGLLAFFEKYKESVDIFCLQEMWSASYDHLEGKNAGGVPIDNASIMTHGVQDISKILINHSAYFRPHLRDNYGIMIFVKKDIEVIEEGEEFVYKHNGYIPEGDAGNHARNIQYVVIKKDGKKLAIYNIHGLWNGKGKTDTEDRLLQSRNIAELIKKHNMDSVLCGDFNLLPDTESVRIIENSGMKNLIKEYNITSTRTSFYNKPVKFADYIFTSTSIVIKDFKVLPDEVSDHAPLFLEII